MINITETDTSGNITDTLHYDTYGKLTSHVGESFIIFGYNGRDGVITDKNGLIYMRARYYSPEMKRFINADIVAGEISNAVTLNRFAYANGNPVSFVDPFGLVADKWDEDEIGYTWQQLGFEYDGSKQDLERLKAGLPPIEYERWLKTGYGYSDDNAYLDVITKNFDAIYVVDYGSHGLDYVGHAYVFLKKDDGSWVKTQYTGNFPNPSFTFLMDAYIAKKKAKIKCLSVENTEIVAALNAPLRIETTTINIGGDPPTFVEIELSVDGVQFVPMKGDFSKSITEAEKYHQQESNYGGYNLITNNCLDYVQEILREGTASDARIEKCLENSITIIPRNFYYELNAIKP